jgi:hypothetical protein
VWGCESGAIDVRAGWIVDGVKITPSSLVKLAHPLVFDTNIAGEGVPSPTRDELQRWDRAPR